MRGRVGTGTLRWAAAAAWMLSALAGCGGGRSGGDAATLTYWRALTGGAGEAQDELARRFTEAHPDTPVRSEFQGGLDDLATKLMTAAVAGTGPDVTQLGTFEIRSFARDGLLVDLRPFLEGPDGLDTSDWPGSIKSAGEVGEGIYWLPFNVAVPVMYYNAEAFKEAGLPGPPETWDQFYDYARRLTTRDAQGNPVRAGVALWDITWPYLSIIWSEGGELTDRDYRNITFDDPAVERVLSELQALVREGAAVLPSAASGGHRAAFRSGRAAMILDSPAPFDEIFQHASGFTPEVAPYPAGRAGRVYAPGGAGIAMLATTAEEKRPAAWSFMKFLLAPESIAYYAERSGYLAFTEGAREIAKGLLEDPRRAIMHDALQHVRGDFAVNMSPAVRLAFDGAFRKIMVEGADVRATLAAADAQAEREIRREQ
jgi:sn-glycerol 3-phosphate transport system substrate-binding protein